MLAYLQPALVTAFNASATLKAAFPGDTGGGGSMYGFALASEVPDEFDAPWIQFTVIAAPREVVYSGTGRNTIQIQFDAIAKGNDAARQAMLVFVGVWDTVTLSPSSGQLFDGTRITDPMPLPDNAGRDEDASANVCGWTTTYTYSTRL